MGAHRQIICESHIYNGANSISAILYFNEAGYLVNFASDDRYEINDKKQYRFSTPVKNYKEIEGRTIPTYGETIWHYPMGNLCTVNSTSPTLNTM